MKSKNKIGTLEHKSVEKNLTDANTALQDANTRLQTERDESRTNAETAEQKQKEAEKKQKNREAEVTLFIRFKPRDVNRQV